MARQDDPVDSGNVVSLSEIRGIGSRPAIAQIEAYWQTTRRGRLVPSRSDVDPRGLHGALEHAFVLERISSGLARFRVAGSHLTELMGLEVRGMPLSSIFVPEARAKLSDAIEAAFDTPATIRLSLVSEAGFGRPRLEGAMVLLPLRSDLGDITRILGAVAMSGQTGRSPRRLEITGEKRRGLTGYAGSDTGLADQFDRPGGRPQIPRSHAIRSAKPKEPKKPQKSNVGFLRLVSDTSRDTDT